MTFHDMCFHALTSLFTVYIERAKCGIRSNIYKCICIYVCTNLNAERDHTVLTPYLAPLLESTRTIMEQKGTLVNNSYRSIQIILSHYFKRRMRDSHRAIITCNYAPWSFRVIWSILLASIMCFFVFWNLGLYSIAGSFSVKFGTTIIIYMVRGHMSLVCVLVWWSQFRYSLYLSVLVYYSSSWG